MSAEMRSKEKEREERVASAEGCSRPFPLEDEDEEARLRVPSSPIHGETGHAIEDLEAAEVESPQLSSTIRCM
jgi:hypothetical protein